MLGLISPLFIHYWYDFSRKTGVASFGFLPYPLRQIDALFAGLLLFEKGGSFYLQNHYFLQALLRPWAFLLVCTIRESDSLIAPNDRIYMRSSFSFSCHALDHLLYHEKAPNHCWPGASDISLHFLLRNHYLPSSHTVMASDAFVAFIIYQAEIVPAIPYQPHMVETQGPFFNGIVMAFVLDEFLLPCGHYTVHHPIKSGGSLG
jgi:hypothetical protein